MSVNPMVLVLPAVILTGGLIAFFLVPLPVGVRAAVLCSDVAAAALVGFVMWRRSQ